MGINFRFGLPGPFSYSHRIGGRRGGGGRVGMFEAIAGSINNLEARKDERGIQKAGSLAAYQDELQERRDALVALGFDADALDSSSAIRAAEARVRLAEQLRAAREKNEFAKSQFAASVDRGRELKKEYGYGPFDKLFPLLAALLIFASFAFPPALVVTLPLEIYAIVRLTRKVIRQRSGRYVPKE